MPTFTVRSVITASGYCHTSNAASAAEALRTAHALYGALNAALGGGYDTETPRVFAEIKRPECTRASAEPRNRAFSVAIHKGA